MITYGSVCVLYSQESLGTEESGYSRQVSVSCDECGLISISEHNDDGAITDCVKLFLEEAKFIAKFLPKVIRHIEKEGIIE